ncbi:MAG: TIGR02679 domain-containing protein [Bacilli bacterium]
MNYVNYFKNKKGFNRFFIELKKKYIKTGKFTGNIILKNITKEESNDFSCFFGTFYLLGKDINISLQKFLKVMNNSKYNDFDFKILIDNYFNENVETNEAINSKKITSQEEFFSNIVKITSSIGHDWLCNIIEEKTDAYNLLIKRYNQNKIILKNDLLKTIKCLNNLPIFNNQSIYLPIFACKYTGDPHFLDIDSKNSLLFIYGLCYVFKVNYPTNRSLKTVLYFKALIVADPISNYAITYNLKIDNKNMFDNQPLILNLCNLQFVANIDSNFKKVYIFENPSILNIILQKEIKASVIITSGNPNLVVYEILDKLILMGNKLFYNGDFDPEGLLIAYKLKQKYKDKLTLFCYNIDDYHNCLSQNEISSIRLKKLDKIELDELNLIKNNLLLNKMPGYQENNIDNIINYMK